MVRRRFTRKELQHDRLVDTVSLVSSHLQRYRRLYLFALTLAVAVALVLSIATVRRSRDRAEASRLLARARTLGQLVEIYENYPATPAAPLALMTAAAHFYRDGRHEQALAAYRAFLDRYPEHSAAPFAALGTAYSLEAMGELEAAGEAFRRAAGHPDASTAPEAAYGRGRIHLQLDRPDQARTIFEELAGRYPWSLYSRRARERLERLDPGDPPPLAPSGLGGPWTD